MFCSSNPDELRITCEEANVAVGLQLSFSLDDIR